MIVSFRSQTSTAMSSTGFHPLRRAGSFGFLAVIGFMVACGSSSSTPADGGAATGGSGSGGAVGTGGTASASDAGTDARRGTGGGAGGNTTAALSLGKVCSTDLECTNGLGCLKAGGNDFYDLGGPAHGYCSTPCATAADQKCSNIGGVCFDTSNAGDGSTLICLQSCVLGSPPDTKCHGRLDVACVPTTADQTSTVGECEPTCSSNAECPSGRNCDFGVCVATSLRVPAADPAGTHCMPAAGGQPDSCKGSTFCLTIGAATAPKNICTRACVLGSPTACEVVDATMSLGSTPHGICLGQLTAAPDVGDVGFCLQQCDTASNCLDQVDTGLICDMSGGAPHGVCSWM